MSDILTVSHAVLPEAGEDSFAMRIDENGAWMCVADGCGGLGSRRYPELANHTGAYIASRLVTRAFGSWADECRPMPAFPEEGKKLGVELAEDLHGMLSRFAEKNCREERSRIVGSMQRRLPSTFCAMRMEEGAAGWKETCFFWTGDSRGYVLDEGGLHQCTQDHLKGSPDALESLYRDMPLADLICADRQAAIGVRRMRAPLPCIILLATDGAYSGLLTPMEFEKLLLDTLLSARSWASWQRKLNNLVKKMAQDDATLLLLPCGFSSLEEMQKRMTPRRAVLQKQYITPVRRHRMEPAFIREKWMRYRTEYDWTAGGKHERMDWRV